jgi:hypothetical protein
MAGRDFSNELFGTSAPSGGRDFSSELFGEPVKRKVALEDIPATDAMGNFTNALPVAQEPDNRGMISRVGDFLRPGFKSVLEAPVTPEQQQLNADRRLGYGAGPISPETEAAAVAARAGTEANKNKTVNKVARAMSAQGNTALADMVASAKDPEVMRAARDAKANEFRSAGEWAADTYSDISQTGLGLVELPLNIFAPSGGLAKTLRKTQNELQAQESDVLKAQRSQLLERVQNEDGFFGKYFATVEGLVTNPALGISEAVKQVPNFLSIMGVAKLGGALTGAAINTASRFSPSIALSEAISGNALRAGAQAAGTTAGGLGASMLMTSGDAAGNTYQTLTDPKKTPMSVWKTNPDFQELVSQGKTPKQAIEEISTTKARLAAALVAPLGALGFMGAEAAILARPGSRAALQAATPKGAAKIFAKELGGEQIEEGGTQLGSNVVTQTVNPQQGLTEGVPEAMATAAVTAAPFAGAAVASQAARALQTPQADLLAEGEARRRLDPQSYEASLVNPASTRKPSVRAAQSKEPALTNESLNAGVDPMGRIEPSLEKTTPVREEIPGMVPESDLDIQEKVTPVTLRENPNEVPEVTPVTPASFAADMAAGKKKTTPEDVQFYLNNAVEIEAELRKLLAKTETETPAPPPPPAAPVTQPAPSEGTTGTTGTTEEGAENIQPPQAAPTPPPAAVQPTKAAESIPETPTVPPAKTPKLFEPPAEQVVLDGLPTVEVPLKDIQLSKDLPQFKTGANAKGVVEPLAGKFERTGVAPVQLWQRLDGRLEIISGRHRFDLAGRSKEATIPAQIHYESQGFDLDKATTLDSELNIRDGQGKVKDYVDYFKGSKITREEAVGKGLLARALGKRAYGIATQGEEALITAVRNDEIGDEAAYYIALNAPNDARLQGVGLQAVMDGKSMQTAINTMQAVKAMAAERDTTTDMFGFDDSLIKEAQEMAKIASKMQQSINTRLSAISGAAKNPDMAKAEGIDVRDPEAVKVRIEDLKAQKAALENWSTSPELVAQIRAARGVEAPQFELKSETPEETVARESTQDAERRTAEEKTKADNEVDFFALQPQTQEKPEAPTTDMFADEAGPSAEYQAANELANRAIAEFGKVQEAYRKREIGDDDFLASKKIHDEAIAAYDAAVAKEQGGDSGTVLRNIEPPQNPSGAPTEDKVVERAELRAEQIKEYAAVRAKLARLPRIVAAGKIDLSVQAAVTRLMQQARDLNFTIRATKSRQDSAERFLAKAAIEFDNGNISEEVFQVIKAAYDKRPELLEGLLLSVKAPVGQFKQTAGQFLPFARIVRLYKETSGTYEPRTIRHELTHSLEQMMTPEQRMAVVQAWGKSLLAAIKKNPDEKHQKYFHSVMDFIDAPNEANFRKAQNLLPSYEMYQFINPSEYWAVNAEQLMASELGTAWGKFKRAIARLWEGVKNVFGFDNRYVVQKTFKNIMNGSKERITKDVLVDLVGRSDTKVQVLGNVEDDKKLVEKHNRPPTPQLDPSPTKTTLVNATKASKEYLKTSFDDPMDALGTAANAIDRGLMYARNKNVWFGSGLNAADFAKYNGQLKTSQGLATASVALDNAIRGSQIGTEVIFQGGIRFDPVSLNFVATEKPLGMRGVYEAENELKKKLGDQLGADIIQGYLEAKRSRSIQNEFYDRQANLETLKETYEQMLESGASEKDIKVARDAFADAKKELQDIEIVFNKINMSDAEIDEFIARDKVHPELGKIMKNWSAINKNMLNFWRQVRLLSEKRYEALSNIQDYVPWQRIMNDEADIHSPVQATNRTMTNIGLERVFKKGTPTVITNFKATEGQQVFKIQPAKVMTVEVNGKTVDPTNIKRTPEGEVRLNVPIAKDDLVVFKASREIENIISNMTSNVTRMTMNGLRQYAAQRIVSEYATRDANNKIMTFPEVDLAKGRFSFITDGKRSVVEIQDPLIAESVIGMETLGIAMYKPLAIAANITRRAITLSGAFQIKQIFKDAPTAALVTGVKNPLALMGGVYKGFVTSLLNTDPTVQILKSAGIGGFQSAARTPEAEIKRRIGIMNRNVFDFMIKGLDHIGDSSDMAQRVAVYKRVMAETGNETQALYQSANVINFLHHGSGQVAQFVVKTVPFAGAYANSIDVLAQGLAGGGLKGNSRAKNLQRLAVTGTLLTTMTLLYCMMVGDDDEYNQMDDQTKLRNFMIPGTKIILPMNTSAAYFFKAIPEMLYNKVVKEGTKNAVDERRLRTALKEAAIDLLLGPTPVPSAVKPFLELGLNKDFFTGRPVVPDSVAKLDAAERYTAETSELGKRISALTGTDEKRLLDPIQADHIVRGIFGSAGAMAQWFSNSIGAAADARVAPTDKQKPIVGPFLRDEVPRRNEDLFYNFKELVDNKYGTYTKMIEREDFDAADKYLDKHSDLVESHDYITEAGTELKDINSMIRYYGESKDTGLTPQERRKEIIDLQRLKQEVLDDVIEFRKNAGL